MANLPARREYPGDLLSIDPWREFELLPSRMRQFFRDAFSDWPAMGFPTVGLDLEETDDAYVVEMEVPGVKREDLSVDVAGNMLRVHGEIKERERTGILRQQTRRTGQFERRITLPGEVDQDSIEASLHDGVLTVRAPKSRDEKPRRVEIKAS